jgi:hypothetical protein
VQGYEHNRGTSYIPFLILDVTGRQVPARFIKVHMTNNPYVEAWLSMDGLVHCGEIHAAAVMDCVTQTPEIGLDKLHILECKYQDWMLVDKVIANIEDWSLMAEILQWQGLQKCCEVMQESICKMEDQLFAIAVDQWVCCC